MMVNIGLLQDTLSELIPGFFLKNLPHHFSFSHPRDNFSGYTSQGMLEFSLNGVFGLTVTKLDSHERNVVVFLPRSR